MPVPMPESVQHELLPALMKLESDPEFRLSLQDMRSNDTESEAQRVGESFVISMQAESGGANREVRRKLSCIAKGQARVAVRISELLKRLEREGMYATAAVMSEALLGDTGQLQAVRDADSDSEFFAEFFAILSALQEIQEQREYIAHPLERLPVYPVLAECTEPESLKLPEQILCGAVSIKAPPALPSDMTRTGYAVGCVA